MSILLCHNKEPDYKIEGEYADNYAPGATKTAPRIRDVISNKVKSGQASRIVVNLSNN